MSGITGMRKVGIALAAAIALVAGVAVPAGAIPEPEEPVAVEANTGLVASDIPPLESSRSFVPGVMEAAPEVAGEPDASVGEVEVEIHATRWSTTELVPGAVSFITEGLASCSSKYEEEAHAINSSHGGYTHCNWPGQYGLEPEF